MSIKTSMESGYALLESIDAEGCDCISGMSKHRPTEKHKKTWDTDDVHLQKLIQQLEKTTANLRYQLNKNIKGTSKVTSKQRLVGWSKGFVRNILWITFVWQVINIAVLMVVCHSDPGYDNHRNGKILFGYYGLVVIQVISTVGILGAAGRLTQQVVVRESVSGWFLTQCYLATVISFTGLYMLTYRLDPASWDIADINPANDVSFIISLFVRFLHLSSSTATLCGISNITPVAWYNYLASTIQMLLSFTYFASILSKIIGSARPSSSSAFTLSSSTHHSQYCDVPFGQSRESCPDQQIFSINNDVENNNATDIYGHAAEYSPSRRRTSSLNV